MLCERLIKVKKDTFRFLWSLDKHNLQEIQQVHLTNLAVSTHYLYTNYSEVTVFPKVLVPPFIFYFNLNVFIVHTTVLYYCTLNI